MTSDQIIFYVIIGIIILLYMRKQWRMKKLKNYSGVEAKEQMKAGSVLLDVRSAAERSAKSIPSSIHIPLHEISSRIKELEKYRSKEIICYCASGSRSVNAAFKLMKAGFTVGNLQYGIGSWDFSKR